MQPTTTNSNEVENRWPGLVAAEGYPTVLAAIAAHSRPGYNTVVVRVGKCATEPNGGGHSEHCVCIAGVFAYQQVRDICTGLHMHHLGAFATVGCRCKSKSNILTNVHLRTGAIRKIEASGFGVQAICAKAPSLGLALVGRYELDAKGQFILAESPQALGNFNAGPFRKLVDRLKSFSRPTLSITARCTGFNTFILSVMPYTISYFGLTTLDLNRLRQAAAKFILKRHWLEAEILPYVLRYFGIATLLDPAVSTIAAIGLYLREGNPIEDLCHQPGREECGNARQKFVVMALLDMWSPFLGLEDLLGALAEGNGPIPKRLSALKKVIITRMVQEAKSRVTKKMYNEGWSGGISPNWVTLLVEAPRAWCNGVGRYTLLRWAVNQDDDVWLSMRGTRYQQKCGTCGLPGESFLYGYYHPPLCESCIRSAGLDAWGLSPWSRQLCSAYMANNCQEQVTAWAQEWEVKPAHDVVCRACGCGDNTIGHWTRWCVVPLIVALSILKPGGRHFTLGQLACQSPRNAAVCTLILASFRRLLRQEGAFLHQQAAEAKLVQWWIVTLHENVARDAHVQLQVDFPICQGAVARCCLNCDQVGVQRILPLDYSSMHLPPVIGVCQVDVSANSQLAAIKEMEVTATPMQSNVRMSIITCQCGAFHVVLFATLDLCQGDTLVPVNTCSPRILVQFDGSAHRAQGV